MKYLTHLKNQTINNLDFQITIVIFFVLLSSSLVMIPETEYGIISNVGWIFFFGSITMIGISLKQKHYESQFTLEGSSNG